MIERGAGRVCRAMCGTLAKHSGGAVHSVFDSALNIRAGDRLLTLLAHHRPLFPFSAVLEAAPAFPQWGAAPGTPVTLENNAIRLNGDTQILVRLDGAVSKDLSIRTLRLDAVPDMERQLGLLARAIGQHPGAAEGLAPALCQLFEGPAPVLPANLWSRHLLDPLQALCGALARPDDPEWEVLGRKLAGCGPGLTPSSDDLLTGVMAALFAAAITEAFPQHMADRAIRGLAAGAIPHTNDISAGFLRSSAEGLFGEPVTGLLTALFAPRNEQGIAASAQAVLAFGSTSGADILTGIWLGLAATLGIPRKAASNKTD